MAKEKSTVAERGIGFTGALTVLFIGLKLGHVIAWSWAWVLSPLWLPIAAVIGLVMLYIVLQTLSDTIEKINRKK